MKGDTYTTTSTPHGHIVVREGNDKKRRVVERSMHWVTCSTHSLTISTKVILKSTTTPPLTALLKNPREKGKSRGWGEVHQRTGSPPFPEPGPQSSQLFYTPGRILPSFWSSEAFLGRVVYRYLSSRFLRRSTDNRMESRWRDFPPGPCSLSECTASDAAATWRSVNSGSITRFKGTPKAPSQKPRMSWKGAYFA